MRVALLLVSAACTPAVSIVSGNTGIVSVTMDCSMDWIGRERVDGCGAICSWLSSYVQPMRGICVARTGSD